MHISDKFMGISPSPTLSIDAKYKQMKADGMDVMGFGCGEPDFDTPQHIKDAAIAAINNGMTKYTPASGTLALKEAICHKFQADNNLSYTPAQIVVSNGAKHALVNAFGAILNPGDEVIIPAPYWVSYPEMVKINDGVPVTIYTDETSGFKATADQIANAITKKTRAIVLNSPSNPTGMVYTKQELEDIAKLAVEKDLFVISDEIYEHLIYDGNKHVSIAQLGEDIKNLTIVVNGVSKTYAMTGWRIGYTASNPTIAKVMGNVQSHATSNPNSIAQEAARAAIVGPRDELDKMVAEFDRRRRYMVDRIANIPGVSCLHPHGAFYVMMNIAPLLGKTCDGKVIENDDVFAELFLEKELVAVVPGSGFMAPGYVRWSYATSMETIVEGLNRLERFIAKLN